MAWFSVWGQGQRWGVGPNKAGVEEGDAVGLKAARWGMRLRAAMGHGAEWGRMGPVVGLGMGPVTVQGCGAKWGRGVA